VKSVVQPAVSSPPSGANTPASQTSSKSNPAAPGGVVFAKKSSGSTSFATSSPLGKPSADYSGAKNVLKSAHRDSRTPPAPKSGVSSFASTSTTKSITKSSSTALQNGRSSASSVKKRVRTPSLDISPPPKRRTLSPNPSRNDLSTEIWKMFGKDRGSYVRKDVLSDDEDMEADARILEKEELRSSRLAKREEEEAMEAERIHEQEKRRRKMEKDRRG